MGTAKPSAEEQAHVPHHLIDLCEPEEAYSVARFCSDAMSAIEQIHRRGKNALLVGGTMLYFNALEKGIARLPDADAGIRAQLEQEAIDAGWGALHARLASVDPVSAARIHQNDPQRLQRALEVYALTGEPLSELQKNTVPLLTMKPVKFALVPESRAWLHERIAKRYHVMLKHGFVEEVSALMQRPGIHAALPSMRSVGYRQVFEHLNGDYNLATMIDKATAATRQLAKRQLTWTRSMEDLQRIASDKLEHSAQVERMLELSSQIQL